MKTDAIFDTTHEYRYMLMRQWGSDKKNFVNFILLNPSTADEKMDDPTIKGCIKFAQNWGCDGLYVTNLFAFRATDPRDLKKTREPIGELNDKYLKEYAKKSKLVIFAWGNHGRYLGRSAIVAKMLSKICVPHCLKITKSGSPKHPLYIKRTSKYSPM